MSGETELERHLLEVLLVEASGTDGAGRERARALVDDVLHLNPARAASYFLAGFAAEALETQLRAPPDEAAARCELRGRLEAALRRGARERALALAAEPLFDSLVADAAVGPGLLIRVAKVASDAGDIPEALDLLERALDLEADARAREVAMDLVTAILSKADHLLKDGKVDDSRTLVENVTRRPGLMACLEHLAVRAWRKLGQCEQKTGDWEAAISCFQDGLAHTPTDSQRAVLWCDIGLCYLGLASINNLVKGQKRERREQARNAFEKAVQAGVGFSINGAYALGVMALEDGQPEKAAEYLEMAHRSLKAMKMRNRSRLEPRLKAYLAEALLSGREARGALPKALNLLNQAHEAAPPSLSERLNAYRLLRTVDEEAARAFLAKLDLSGLKSVSDGLSIGDELLAENEPSHALEAATALLRLFLRKPDRREALILKLKAENALADVKAGVATFSELKQLCFDHDYLQEFEAALLDHRCVSEVLDANERRKECLELYGLMPDRKANRASLLVELARGYVNSRDEDGLRTARALLEEAALLHQAELPPAELEGLMERLEFEAQRLGIELTGTSPDASLVRRLRAHFPAPPRVLVVGGNEKQTGDRESFLKLGEELHFTPEWIPANYINPDKPLAVVRARLSQGLKALILLHYNRTEFGRSARRLAGEHNVVLRNLHLYGFKSLRACVVEVLEKLLKMEEQQAHR